MMKDVKYVDMERMSDLVTACCQDVMKSEAIDVCVLLFPGSRCLEQKQQKQQQQLPSTQAWRRAPWKLATSRD
jgi:hypothetical protein